MKAFMATLVALLTCAALPGGATAQTVERYFRFEIKDRSELDRLTRAISIASVHQGTVHAFANEKEWTAFKSLGYDAVELPYPGRQSRREVADSPTGLREWDKYPTYQTYLTMMARYADDFPDLCKLDTIGLSVQGRLILALKISTNVHAREDEPQVFYTSSIHGLELTGYVLLLRLADYLLSQYGLATPEGQRVTTILDNTEIWLNPLFNPDGAYRLGGDTSVSGATRYNANGVDLNRNFPDRITNPNNTVDGREPETQAMMLWTRDHNFTLSANLHSGSLVVNYPWDNGAASGEYSRCPDDSVFIRLAGTYATPNPDIMGGGFPNGITNGCQWYAVYGGRQDWMYWWNGGREVTVELDTTGLPPGSWLPLYWMHNQESFLAYMEATWQGIRGIVTDADTDLPLKARLEASDSLSLPVYSDSTVGDYHYLLLPGAYAITVHSPGYEPETVHTVVVADSSATRLDVALRRIPVTVDGAPPGVPRHAALSQNHPNPFNSSTTIRYELPTSAMVTLSVCDLLGREVAVLVSERRDAGIHEVRFDGSGLSSGVYVCRLHALDAVRSKKLVLLK